VLKKLYSKIMVSRWHVKQYQGSGKVALGKSGKKHQDSTLPATLYHGQMVTKEDFSTAKVI